MTIDNLKIPTVALGTWAWGDSGETGDGYFGSSLTQADLAAYAQVSRRWLSDLEAGKPTAEVGLVFKVLHALDVALDASPVEWGLGDIDLDDVLRTQGQLGGGETGRGR